jgi:hypothetical protein
VSAIRRLLVLTALAISIALVAAPFAGAYWDYFGWVPNGYDRSCLWYATSARCSGWNRWEFVESTVYSGGPVLIGFENYERIRGQYVYAGQYRETDPWMIGMCCYLIAHGTNTSVPAWASLWATSR